MKKIKKRIPRPLGLTIQVIDERKAIQQGLPDNHKTNRPHNNISLTENSPIVQLIINNYIANDMRINGRYYSIEDLANWLNLPILTITKLTTITYHKQIELIGQNTDITYNGLKGIASGLLKFGLVTHAKASEQSAALMQAQQGVYVPFLTSEVNKSIRAEVDSLKPLIELLNSLKPPTTTNLNIGNFFGPQEQKEAYLTSDKAIEMLNNNSIMGDSGLQDIRAQQLLAEKVPEVDARLIDSHHIKPENIDKIKQEKAKEQQERATKNIIEEVIDDTELIG